MVEKIDRKAPRSDLRGRWYRGVFMMCFGLRTKAEMKTEEIWARWAPTLCGYGPARSGLMGLVRPARLRGEGGTPVRFRGLYCAQKGVPRAQVWSAISGRCAKTTRRWGSGSRLLSQTGVCLLPYRAEQLGSRLFDAAKDDRSRNVREPVRHVTRPGRPV